MEQRIRTKSHGDRGLSQRPAKQWLVQVNDGRRTETQRKNVRTEYVYTVCTCVHCMCVCVCFYVCVCVCVCVCVHFSSGDI